MGELPQDERVARKVIWMDGWEMECCGKPFAVGSRVTWMLGVADQACKDRLAALLGEAQGLRLTHFETHHGPHDDPLTYVTGTVVGIKTIYQAYDGRGRRVEGTAYTDDCESAVRWHDEEVNAPVRFQGYLIDLETP
jgi:hypothetical protein